jgi:ABC-type uncharacterized transport system fused permease/ATPase subunit
MTLSNLSSLCRPISSAQYVSLRSRKFPNNNNIGPIRTLNSILVSAIKYPRLFEVLTHVRSWCFLGGLVSYFLARRVPSVEYALEKREGDLRFSHMRVRTYAESIAFFGGETQEKSNTQLCISKFIKSFEQI